MPEIASAAPVSSILSTAIAFKEWSLVCEELAAGASSLILRKGGIAEGRAGFEWKHEAFYLFPTHFHEQEAGLKVASRGYRMPEAGNHRLDFAATLEGSFTLQNWDAVNALAAHHPWTEDVVRERFSYGEAGSLSVALVRVYKLAEPILFADAPGYGGCRSWVKVPATAEIDFSAPVLSQTAHEERLNQLRAILGT